MEFLREYLNILFIFLSMVLFAVNFIFRDASHSGSLVASSLKALYVMMWQSKYIPSGIFFV